MLVSSQQETQQALELLPEVQLQALADLPTSLVELRQGRLELRPGRLEALKNLPLHLGHHT